LIFQVKEFLVENQLISLIDIFLFTKETGKCLRNNVNIAQIQATIGIEIQEKLLTISTNPDDGSAEFNFDLPITDLSAYKMKFSVIKFANITPYFTIENC